MKMYDNIQLNTSIIEYFFLLFLRNNERGAEGREYSLFLLIYNFMKLLRIKSYVRWEGDLKFT